MGFVGMPESELVHVDATKNCLTNSGVFLGVLEPMTLNKIPYARPIQLGACGPGTAHLNYSLAHKWLPVNEAGLCDK